MCSQNQTLKIEQVTIIALYNSMRNILGISLGSRFVGIAVLYDGELTDFRVRTFFGAWNDSKRRDMIQTITQTIKRYGIHKIVVKTPKPFHCSQSITDLTNDILQLADTLKIRVMVCTISMLTNKETLIQSVIRKYPTHRRLADLYEKERKKHSHYYVKLFEAIVCTELAQKTDK
jgi:RNase H-fold protein (predicted Holliday junction resolvase)